MSEDITPPTDDPGYLKAVDIVETLQQEGYQAVFAGGCVRDLLRNKKPKDYDIATEARPERVESLFSNTVAVGKAFGVIMVVQGEEQFEVATFRQDDEYKDGRRPESVEFCSPKEDVKRRDFTVNGLLWDPLQNRVLDFVSGREDLEHQRLQAIGTPDRRFTEDYLRMLRAPRFAAQLGFEIERETADSIKRNADRIQDIAAERIQDEMNELMNTADPGRGILLMERLNLLEPLFPEVDRLKEIQTEKGSVLDHTVNCLQRMGEIGGTEETGYAILFHDVARPFIDNDVCTPTSDEVQTVERVDNVLRRLRPSNEVRNKVNWIIRVLPRIVHSSSPSLAEKKRFVTHERWPELRVVAEAILRGDQRSSELLEELIELKENTPESDLDPDPLLTGDDLLNMGLEEGPRVGEILEKIRCQQLNENLSSPDEARAFVRDLLQENNGK